MAGPRLGMPGIADAKHSFTVEDDGAGGSRVSQTEVFRGVLAPLPRERLPPGLETRTAAPLVRAVGSPSGPAPRGRSSTA